MRSHAPSLKVLVYEGWSKLPSHVQHSSTNSPYVQTKGAKGKASAPPVDEGDMGIEPDRPITWAEYVHSFDVCITTYNVLQHDLNVARAPPKRPRREIADYSRTVRARSPLVCVEFFRVIMDEVRFNRHTYFPLLPKQE